MNKNNLNLVLQTFKQKIKNERYLITFFLALILSIGFQTGYGQNYDILLKGGHVIDPKNNIDGQFDVAINGDIIARVANNIPAGEAEKVVDVSGLYVTPGLIDMHGHHFYGTQPNSYLSNGFTAVEPDGFTLRSGVTTAVDAGGPGWRNYRQFKEQVIDRSTTRVLAFINIVGSGMSGVVPDEQNVGDMDPKLTAMVADQFADEIVGVKIAHYRGHDWTPFKRAAEAGQMADIPVMVDLGGVDPPLPLETLFMDILSPGDILTHMYGRSSSGHGPKEAALDDNGQLRDHWMEAQERGIIFDVGHGGGSFFYDIAVPASEQGLWPNTISTDLHKGSMNGGMKNMANVISKIMDMGMPLQEAIAASTWKPAQVIQREDLGHLSEGAVADVAVLNLKEGDFGFLDSRSNLNPGNQKLVAELTLRAGQVVYDLNGLAAPRWDAQ